MKNVKITERTSEEVRITEIYLEEETEKATYHIQFNKETYEGKLAIALLRKIKNKAAYVAHALCAYEEKIRPEEEKRLAELLKEVE